MPASAPNELVYSPTADIAARTLLQTEAFVVAEEMRVDKFFEWKSGVRAPVYTDCRVIQAHPGPTATLVRALSRSLENSFAGCEAVVGMAEAGIFWSTGVALQLGLPHAFVRKALKSHGRKGWIAGGVNEGDRVVLVDDLMAGGGTALEAIDRIEDETGAEVVGVQTIVNWNFAEMREKFCRINVPFRALVSYDDVIDAAVASGRLTTAAANELRAFFRNPRSHDWRLENLSLRTLRAAAANGADDLAGQGERS